MADERFRFLADRAGLTDEFPAQVLADVDAFLAKPGLDDPALVDRMAIPFVTIDGPGTRDLDQAVHAEAVGDGWRLRYAIADASYYVRPGTALFDEALRRGASYYLPGLSIPMLPRALSEGLVSLGPDATRRALVFDVSLDAHGTVTDFTLERARVASRAQLSWDQAETYTGDAAIAASLFAIGRVGALRAVHEERAAMVRYRRTETSVRLGADGMLVIDGAPRTAVELANEQISILCNALGARYLLGGSAELVQPIYRIHPPPDEMKVAAFERLVGMVAAERGLPDDPWVYRRAADIGLAGYLEHLPTSGPEGRLARALHRQAMMLNGRSRFAGEPSGHFGVGELVYSRFTAPMREMVGVQCHAQAIDRMQGSSGRTREEDLAIRARVIEAGNRAKDTQRKLDREIDALAVAAVLGPDLALAVDDRPLRTGTCVGLAAAKVFVVLDDPPIDVRVSLYDQGKHLGGAWLDLVDDGTRLLRRDDGTQVCRLGDEVKVRAIAPDGCVLA